ncbi:MAG: lysylphosphatidylglycerol synthase domain-containing protein, partial [Planctomycetota bacterium]
ARIALYTLLAWLLIAASTWIGIRACGVQISFGSTLIILPLLVLGIALPTPGGAGGYHAAMRVGLIQLFGVAEPAAVGAGLLVHAAVVLPVILLGVLILIVDRIPIQDLVEAVRQVRLLGASPPPVTNTPVRPAEKLS